MVNNRYTGTVYSSAQGHILGSNVFNVLLILGGSALINPLSFADISLLDLGVVILSAVLVWMSVFTGKKDKLDRFDGTLMILVWLSYMIYLLINL